MTAITSTEMLMSLLNESLLTVASECAYSAPPMPARKPPSAKPWILTIAAGIVKARALSSLSRTARNIRPMPLLRTLAAISRHTIAIPRAKK
jgi:hypothetical protein